MKHIALSLILTAVLFCSCGSNGRSSESRQARLDGRVVTDEGEANDDADLRFSVNVDTQEPITYSLKEPFRSERWKLNVLSGQAVRDTEAHLSKGSHTLTIRALDDHIVIDQIIIL